MVAKLDIFLGFFGTFFGYKIFEMSAVPVLGHSMRALQMIPVCARFSEIITSIYDR